MTNEHTLVLVSWKYCSNALLHESEENEAHKEASNHTQEANLDGRGQKSLETTSLPLKYVLI